MCLNYVGLNSHTRPDRYPLPNIEDIYPWMPGKRFFSIIDLLFGYWQVPVHANSQAYIAFITSKGLFQWRTLPFGLRNALSHFQRILSTKLKPLIGHYCKVYIDDIIIFSSTPQEHLTHI